MTFEVAKGKKKRDYTANDRHIHRFWLNLLQNLLQMIFLLKMLFLLISLMSHIKN